MKSKSYKIYKRRIHKLAKLTNLKISYCPPNPKHWDDGYYFKRKVVIYKHHWNVGGYQIAVLLHELGHFFDEQNPRSNSSKQEEAYTRYLEDKPLNKEQHRLVVNCERRAWDEAIVIAKLLKIPLGAWFKKARKAGLNFYKNKVDINY